MAPSISRAEWKPTVAVVKPKAVRIGSAIGVFAPASPAEENRIQRGLEELRSLGLIPQATFSRQSQAYFSASAEARLSDLRALLSDPAISALFASRGGYGANYMLEELWAQPALPEKCIVGYSDVTSLQILLWQKFRWTSLYGPMVAAGLDAGAGKPHGYDKPSLESALFGATPRWRVGLDGETMQSGASEGILLGGCLTLLETTLGTPWELDTAGSILLLEDRGMKPWQIDRALMHLTQAGKLKRVKGIVLGEFPDCPPPVAGSPTAKEVCERILKPLGVPIVYGAAVGHTLRPMLTIPLGIPARLAAEAAGTLEFLETAVTPSEKAK